jgi:kynurenine formamidase
MFDPDPTYAQDQAPAYPPRLINLSPAASHGHWPPQRTSPARRSGRHEGAALRAFPDQDPRGAATLDCVVGTAVVLDLTPVGARASIDASALGQAEARLLSAGATIRPQEILLLRTDWTERTIDNPSWFRHSPSLTPDAVRWLVAHRPSCLGCDFFEADAPVQHQILAAGIALVDGLVNLAALPPRCEFFAPFCDFSAPRAASVRAVAWAWETA